MLLIILMAFFARIPHRLKCLCKAVLCIAIVFLALILIFVYNSEPAGILPLITSDETQPDSVPRHVKKQVIMACSDNMFISLEGCLPCPNGTFSFSGWRKCEPLLNCSDIALQVQNRQRIRGGFTKNIWLADWKGHEVVYLKCKSEGVKTRCLRGMTRMEKLQSPFVTNLIGKCYEKLEIVTAYYKHGSAKTLNQLLRRPQFSNFNNIQTRFQLIVDYVKIMNFMHNSPIGTRVMCDTGNMGKLLSQYLITDDFHLVVNDLDNTPDVRQEDRILCNGLKRKGSGEWYAPEQRWSDNLDLTPKNNEKIEIWKVPAIVEKLLGEVDGSSFVTGKLERMLKRCQATNSKKRPTANELLQELLRVQKLITQ
ncbi:hypothetical protein ACROYT_G012736 [Oculina patagonica]